MTNAGAQTLRTVGEWLRVLDTADVSTIRALRDIYGDDLQLIRERIIACRQVLKEFAAVFGGDKKVLIIRAPGRVNLMGRHVDHQGCYVNPIAINREVLIVVQPRKDDLVVAHNLDKNSFQPGSFGIKEELTRGDSNSWKEYLSSRNVRTKVEETRGNWLNYLKAAILRLAVEFKDKSLCGMNIMVGGDIPISAGLASSSAMVVAAAEACVEVNELDILPQKLVDLCCEGEYYVGTFGGGGDHAAIKLSRTGQVLRVRFLPLKVEGYLPFFPEYRLVICNSLVEAAKSENARSIFNERVSTYYFALMLIQRSHPQFRKRLEHLKDLCSFAASLEGEARIYQILRSLPQKITRAQLLQYLPKDYHRRLEELFQNHREPRDGYKVRDVCLFGLAECARSRACAEYLRKGDANTFGDLMKISHDGDRVYSFDENGKEQGYENLLTDARLDTLVEDLTSGDSARIARAHLFQQPGEYRCSVKEVDKLVDIALRTKGVVGAQLSAAGLGGCIMVLVHREYVEGLLKELEKRYYNTSDKKLRKAVFVCLPIGGSGTFKL